MPIAVSITVNQARRAALNTSLLDGRWKSRAKGAGLVSGAGRVAELAEQLGYIQIDTIAVIERAHHHTIWNRIPSYSPGHLARALETERSVFEYWGHAACYLPLTDYRWYLPLMKRYRDKPGGWTQSVRNKHGSLMKEVLARITAEGPLSTSEFEHPQRTGGTWWDWKPAKAALELLFWQGDLMITARRNFQRVYDLTERVLPSGTNTTCPTDAELGRFLVKRALAAYGIAEDKDIREHLRVASPGIVDNALKQMVADGEVVQLKVADTAGEYFALPGAIEKARQLRPVKQRLYLLSPFDNLVIQRRRLQRLFDFNYTIECYTPEPKRKYGYFCLPILWGEQLVGRLDPKADRQSGMLLIRNLVLEPGFSPDDAFLIELATGLRRFAEFNGCTGIKVSRTSPAKLRAPLQRLVGNSA